MNQECANQTNDLPIDQTVTLPSEQCVSHVDLFLRTIDHQCMPNVLRNGIDEIAIMENMNSIVTSLIEPAARKRKMNDVLL